MAPVLLSRALDPLLGIFTGMFAYGLYETNPRTAVPHQERLSELLKWKWEKWRSEREIKLASGSDDEAILKAISGEDDKH
ncbi:hypothetical protein AcW1_005674 [Taiwanofungus camphoratus]|nr:hypothetical protein AcW2_004438 [Antrodia cinnamomea]KAI0933115.1 hypothetical protein AcV7_004682 [Antrodia cinnamomea]KAI0934014.1 hypothetical protein AcV5_006001 [Antrodia cinnamomea]KAI0957206.1 hypothetical protein AcW1_005674 [Antrodia cinnamomea]